MSSANRQRQKTANKTMPTYLTGTKKNEGWARVFSDVVLSERFQSMSRPAQLLYFFCRMQIADPTARAALYKHAEAEEKLTGVSHEEWKRKSNDRYFVFPEAHCHRYGFTGAHRSKYMAELQENGFVTTVEQNKHRFRDKKMNVFCLSGLWTKDKEEIKRIRETAKGKRTQDNVAEEVAKQMAQKPQKQEIQNDDFELVDDVPDWIPF